MEEKKNKIKKIAAVIIVILLLLVSFSGGIFLGKNIFVNNDSEHKIKKNSSAMNISESDIVNDNIAAEKYESKSADTYGRQNPENIDLLKNSLHLNKVENEIDSSDEIEINKDYFDDEDDFVYDDKKNRNNQKIKNNLIEDYDSENFKNSNENKTIKTDNEKNTKSRKADSNDFENESDENLEANEVKSIASGKKSKNSKNKSELSVVENENNVSKNEVSIVNSEITENEAKSKKNKSVIKNSDEKSKIDNSESVNSVKEKSKNELEADDVEIESDSDKNKTKSKNKKSKNQKTEDSEKNKFDESNKINESKNSDESSKTNESNKTNESKNSEEVLEKENILTVSNETDSKNSDVENIEKNIADFNDDNESKKTELEKNKVTTKNKTVETQISDSENENSFVSSYADNEKKDIEMLNRQLEEISGTSDDDLIYNEEDEILVDSLQKTRINNVKKIEEDLIKINESYKKTIDEINDEIEKGKKSLTEGNITEAFSHFEKADSLVNDFVKENEEVPESFASLKESEIAAVILENSKNDNFSNGNGEKDFLLNQTKEFAERSIKNDDTNADAFFILAQKEELEGNYQNEIEELLQAIENDGNNYLYYFQLGKSQYRMTLFEDANLSFNKSIELKDDFYPTWFDLGLSCKKIKKYDEGKSAFEKTLDLNDVHIKSFFELAQIAILNSDFELAEQYYKNVLKMDENNIQALLLLGTVCKIENKLADAEFYFKKTLPLLKSEYELILTKYNLSTVLLAEIKTKEAEKYAAEAYKNAGKLEKKDQSFIEDIYYNYAFILDENGKAFDSIDIYSELLKINPDHEKTKNNLAVMMMKLDPPDTDNALALVYSVYKKNKNNFEATNNMGTILFKIEEYEKAAVFYKEAMELMPESSVVRNNLAKTYIAMGKIDDARDVFIESLKINENNYQAYIELARICFEKGDDAGAKRYLIQLQQRNSLYGIDKIEEILDSFEKE